VSESGPPITISITPEPSPEELAAITAALAAAVAMQGARDDANHGSSVDVPSSSRWARQGRLDAMRGLDRLPSE
jgi:hypothetical protein